MTGSEDSPADVAAAYFDAWKSNDIERVRPLVHDDVAFDGALGSTQGIEETIAGLGRMFAMTAQVEVVHRWVDGPDVITWFELRTKTAGPLAIVNWSRVEAGRITRIRVTFDPRPLLSCGGARRDSCSRSVIDSARRAGVWLSAGRSGLTTFRVARALLVGTNCGKDRHLLR